MRIVIITPPWTETLGSFAKVGKDFVYAPALGMGYLAAVAEKRGDDVELINAEVENLSFDDQVEKVVSFKPDIIGISSTSPVFHLATRLSGTFRGKKCIPIVIGGPHLSLLGIEAFEECFDFGIYGEGEDTFVELLNTFEKKRNFAGIKGLIYRDGNEVKVNSPRPFIEDVSSLPFPARHLLNMDLYKIPTRKKGKVRYTAVMTMRGCPFQCVFCTEPAMMGKRVRFRAATNVVDELALCYSRFGIEHFTFTDSTLTLKRKHIMDICTELARRHLPITWEGWTRVDLVDEEILSIMKETGCIRICFGVESADPEVLRLIKKNVKIEDIKRAFDIAKKVGMETYCSIMLGLPGDTKEKVLKTIAFVKGIKSIDYSNFSIANPYPGSELYEMASKGMYGLKLITRDFSKFTRYDNSVMIVNDLDREQLVKLQKIGLLKMHLTPRRLWYSFRRIKLIHLGPVFLKMLGLYAINFFRTKRGSHK